MKSRRRSAATAWAAWKRFAHIVGNFQARVLLSFFYFMIVPLFALLVKMVKDDPLALRRVSGRSYWTERHPIDTSMDWGRRQY